MRVRVYEALKAGNYEIYTDYRHGDSHRVGAALKEALGATRVGAIGEFGFHVEGLSTKPKAKHLRKIFDQIYEVPTEYPIYRREHADLLSVTFHLQSPSEPAWLTVYDQEDWMWRIRAGKLPGVDDNCVFLVDETIVGDGAPSRLLKIELSSRLFAKDRDNIAAFAVEQLLKLIAEREAKSPEQLAEEQAM